jgi:hypothetical protein
LKGGAGRVTDVFNVGARLIYLYIRGALHLEGIDGGGIGVIQLHGVSLEHLDYRFIPTYCGWGVIDVILL